MGKGRSRRLVPRFRRADGARGESFSRVSTSALGAALCGRLAPPGIQPARRARSIDLTRSPVVVSQKREYFKYPAETIGDFALEVAKFGAWRSTANVQKPAIRGHF